MTQNDLNDFRKLLRSLMESGIEGVTRLNIGNNAQVAMTAYQEGIMTVLIILNTPKNKVSIFSSESGISQVYSNDPKTTNLLRWYWSSSSLVVRNH